MNESPSPDLDPVLSRVLAASFQSVCSEMGSAMIRTAVSAVFVEGRDFSCALLDDRAELVAAANYDPSHLSAMPITAEYALMDIGWENIHEGDVIVVNDPFRGGGHLTDICVIRPVYCDGELLAIAVNRGHHIDIGGMAVAGFPGTARSIYQEGLRVPPVKWFEAGEERRDVLDIILLNVRFPRAQLGDLRGQLASCITAERRLHHLAARHGVKTVKAAMVATKDHSERLMRKALTAVPDGSYEFSDVMEDDGHGSEAYRVQVQLRIDADEAEIDFAGTSAQALGPVNSSFANTVGSCFNALLHALGDDLTFNHGCFRPIKFSIPRGSLLNPVAPAPVFGGVTETSIRVIDAISGALAQALPGRVPAASYGTCLNFSGGGWDAERNQAFGFYLFQEGGWGATPWRDGWTSVPNPTSNFNDYPAEVAETELPLRCVAIELNEGSGGPGEFRGGLGTRRVYEVMAEDATVNSLGERLMVAPYGLAGGDPGAKSRLLVERRESDENVAFDRAFGLDSPSKFANVPLQRGDRFTLETGGGGGFGDPWTRSPALVLEDVQEGLISISSAADDYGVVIRQNGGQAEIDPEATASLRGKERAMRPKPEPRPTRPSAIEDPQVAASVSRAEELWRSTAEQIGDDPCRSRCPKQADPVRCPFWHPFAGDFWEADALEGWSVKNCLIEEEH